MSSFLTNVNKTKIESKHISGKVKLNPIADLQSRNPADCRSEFCSICKFINETITSQKILDSPTDRHEKRLRTPIRPAR